jgi:ComF family protein
VLCKRLLAKEETDFCHECREKAPQFEKSAFKLSFVAGWTSVWYYKDTVRESILRYKFGGRRSYAGAYGRVLAMKLQKEGRDDFDVVTYVPIAFIRKMKRGYDQVALLTEAVGKELNVPAVKTLRKIRNTPPQSGILDAARRRANVLGAYKAVSPELFRGKRVLLLDDIITTGATASECARVLLTAGAKEVYCAALAVSNHKNSR